MLRSLSVLLFSAWVVAGCGQVDISQDQSTHQPVLGSALDAPLGLDRENGKIIQLYKGKAWVLAKHFPSGYLDIFPSEDGGVASAPIPLPLRFRKDSYPLWAGEGKLGDLYIVVYDVMKNSPSGRTLSEVHEGLSVYRLSEKGNFSSIVEDLPLGGIDTQIYGTVRDSGIDICGDNSCYSIGKDASVKKWDTGFATSDEFIEVNFSSDGAAAVSRKKFDDRLQGEISEDYSKYTIYAFDEGGLKQEREIENGVPYALRWDGSSLFYREAVSGGDYINLFLFDLLKMRFNGLLDFGSNNLEGRVAWSQVYYINGLLSLLKIDDKNLVNDEIRGRLENRVRKEVSLIADLCDYEYPGYEVKRYSIDRENVLFALHLGRVLDLFNRASSVVAGDEKIQSCKIKIKNEMKLLDRTVEKISERHEGSGSEMVMSYRYGYPFWADGANVPFNYISGYITGLLGFDRGADDVDRARKLSKPLISEEFKNRLPASWRYWQGVGDRGWKSADHVSLNTPDYVGNKKAMAHITYRTMDAYALLKLDQAADGVVSDDLVQHFRVLVERGYLLPSLNEVFFDHGDAPVVMNPLVENRYARSAYAYELESQVWALRQLAQENYHRRVD
ncbi:hypothetical protein [Castellaniella ginsengisoli]|uniref:Uncharacterized protein n=1 Tax=Castellaniella ginsengisoli TaxID=546114 RepID=A0AB39CJ89_9BURK